MERAVTASLGSPASPDRLDRGLHLTTPKGWVGVTTALLTIAAVVASPLVAEVAVWVRDDGTVVSSGAPGEIGAKTPGRGARGIGKSPSGASLPEPSSRGERKGWT